MLAHLSRVVLMVRSGQGLANALEFYSAGLGLQVVRATDEWADLRTIPPPPTDTNPAQQPQSLSICLRAVTSESQVTTGYSPLLQFQVENMDEVVAKCVQLGGNLDGPIQYPAHGKIGCLAEPRRTHDWDIRTSKSLKYCWGCQCDMRNSVGRNTFVHDS